MATTYALARLTPEQESLLREAEETLGGGILLAYSRSGEPTGERGPDSVLQYSELNASQLECLEGLERQLGLVVVAVRPF
jgi:hypothetical protein